jgi:GT2 family glycosyltransferase
VVQRRQGFARLMPIDLQNAPLVYVVILHWKNYDYTRAAIESILANNYENYQLIVVDNASRNGSVETLQQKFPSVRFIINQTNLGFSKGCNVGIREALTDSRCAYVLLMNNDATISNASLMAAIGAGEDDPAIGIVSGKILLSRPPHTIWYAGGRIDFWRGQAIGRGFGEADRGQYDSPCETGFSSGALMLIKRAVLERVGLLPEAYFFGVEEWDYSAQVIRAGLKLQYVPDFLGYHAADGSHWNYDPKFVYNSYRNKLIFQQKYLPRFVFPFWKAAFAFYGKRLARRARQRLINKNLFSVPQPVEFDQLDFALARAIKDHARNEMSEAVLNSFDAELRERFGLQPSPTPTEGTVSCI